MATYTFFIARLKKRFACADVNYVACVMVGGVGGTKEVDFRDGPWFYVKVHVLDAKMAVLPLQI